MDFTIWIILYLNKSIEQFGSGFKRIDSLCKDAKIRYSYEISELGFKFIIYRNNQKEIDKKDYVTENVTENVTLNKTELAIYNLLNINSNYTRDELAEKTSKTVRTVQRTLDSLRNKKLIERIGSIRVDIGELLSNYKIST